MIKAFITNKNKPRVIKVAGRVKKINKGLTMLLSNPITNATHIAYV